jgi:erythromycin esterase-like protein
MPKAILSRQLETVAHPLIGTPADYDPLPALVGNARFVLLGAASHGTHEFYRERAQITKKRREAPAFMPGMDRRWARRAQCPRAQQDPRSA